MSATDYEAPRPMGRAYAAFQDSTELLDIDHIRVIANDPSIMGFAE